MSSLNNRRWAIGTVAVPIALILSSISVYLFARDPYSETQIRRLVTSAYNSQRPGGGRLTGASYSEVGTPVSGHADLTKAQILLLRQPETVIRQRLQALVYLASGDWANFVEIIGKLPREISGGSEYENNLGTSFLALSEKDPTYLLKALDAFERASSLAPKSPEPRFNLVITYRKLRLDGLAVDALKSYAELDPASAWQRELTNTTSLDEAAIHDQLTRAIENNNIAEAEQLFEKNPELCRRIAMGYALRNVEESPVLLRFIAAQMERRYRDKTISAMLEPLFTEKREITVALREYVTQGANSYSDGNFVASSQAYAKAQGLLAKTDSVFDRLWLDLNQVDTQIRIGEFEAARQSVQHITLTARDHGLTWIMAKALAIYGGTLKLTSSYSEMLTLVEQANRIFLEIDAPTDRIRPLYYLSAYRYIAGDQNEALKLALECLRLTDDSLRIATLDWLIGLILHRQGILPRAMFFEKEAVERSQKGAYAAGAATTALTLAQLYESAADYKLAAQYVTIAENSFQAIPSGFDQARTEQLLDIVKARLELSQKNYSAAQALLERNLDLYPRQPFQASPLRSQSLMLLARAYSETDRLREAAQRFNQAIDLAESDDQYLESERWRVKFDDERRELYDSAIEFQYNKGSQDAAWTFLQKYRAKLFLEFLAQFNPRIATARAQLDRARVQQVIPKDTQIIEYALLKDQLLIWLVTDKIFTVKSVSVTRIELEDRVQAVLQKLRAGDDVDLPLTELGSILIGPVAPLLDPSRTIAIIPDRALHGMPFGALKLPGKREYLIQSFPIVVSPSLTHFLTANAAQPERDSIVGFGSQNGGSSEVKELAAIKGIYLKTTMATGTQVDKTSFLAAMNKAAVFHYAGHSVTDAVDPLRSSILLDGRRSGPNSVTAVDISQQRLANNAVVILSSCDSSVGNSRDGVGVRGLTSAFLIAGAGSVVGSLWPVEASSTADLMIRFHRAFANSHMPVAKALREAQLAFLQSSSERSHPYYWSGFVVTGNVTALR